MVAQHAIKTEGQNDRSIFSKASLPGDDEN